MDQSTYTSSTEAYDDIPDEEMDMLEEAFDLFDFWDGRDGLIDASKLGDLLRCVRLNPTNGIVRNVGGCSEYGEEHYNFDDFLTIYENTKMATASNHQGDKMADDIREALKSFDREGRGFISMAELRMLLTTQGETLTDKEVDEILKDTDTKVDIHGDIDYGGMRKLENRSSDIEITSVLQETWMGLLSGMDSLPDKYEFLDKVMEGPKDWRPASLS